MEVLTKLICRNPTFMICNTNNKYIQDCLVGEEQCDFAMTFV